MTTFQPTQFEDGGPGSGSLRDLILQANASGEDTTIELQSGGVFTLSIENADNTLGAADDEDEGLTGDLDVNNAFSGATLTIRGLEEGATIDAGGIDRVFDVVSEVDLSLGLLGDNQIGSRLVLENVTVTGGLTGVDGVFSGPVSGGGILVGGASTLTVANSTIAGNTASGSNDGGGIASYGTVNLDTVTLANNSSEGSGGGLFLSGGGTDSATIENSTIAGNTAALFGGGLSQAGGTLTVNNSTIENNSAEASGGGVANNGLITSSEGVLNITESTITGNTAASSGGGVFSDGAGTVSSSTVENNTANEGGGIGTDGPNSDVTFSVVNTRVANNTAASGGGVFAGLSLGRVDIINSTIELNTATDASGVGGGGGIGGGSATVLFVYNSEVLNNTSAGRGGGVGVSTLASIANSTIANNSATGDGGGISTLNSSSSIAFSTISNNTAGGSGGGIDAGPGATSYFINIANSTIANNTANGSGGGIDVAAGLIAGNVEYTVGDVSYVYQSADSAPTDATIVNSTITGNVADADNTGDQGGGGLSVPPFIQFGFSAIVPGTVTLQNSIISGNSDTPNNAGTNATAPEISGPVRGNSNNLLSSTEGVYEVLLDPDATIGGPNDIVTPDAGLGPLADNGGDTQTIALLPGSPAIDAGDNGAIAADFFDADDDGDTEEPVPFEQRFTGADADVEFSGLPRIVGDAVDIGAFEFDDTLSTDPGPPDDTPVDPDPNPPDDAPANPSPPDDAPDPDAPGDTPAGSGLVTGDDGFTTGINGLVVEGVGTFDVTFQFGSFNDLFGTDALDEAGFNPSGFELLAGDDAATAATAISSALGDSALTAFGAGVTNTGSSDGVFIPDFATVTADTVTGLLDVNDDAAEDVIEAFELVRSESPEAEFTDQISNPPSPITGIPTPPTFFANSFELPIAAFSPADPVTSPDDAPAPDPDPVPDPVPDDTPADPVTPDSLGTGSLNVDGFGEVVPAVDVLNIFRVLAGAPQAVVVPDGAGVSQQEIVDAVNAISDSALNVDGFGNVVPAVDVLNIFRVLAGAPQAVVVPDGASVSQQDIVDAVNELVT